MDNHDDTTTTEYDSGGSEGVDYVYEGQQVITQASIESSRKQTDKGPERKTSPKGKQRSTPTRCTCGAGQKGSDGESTTSDDDTEKEDGTEKRLSGPTKPRPSRPENGNERPCGCDEKEHTCCRKKAAKKTGKRTPYIEEYPDEIRPMVLLKEHKLPRRSSVSDPKRNRPEDYQMSSSLGMIQSMGKRPPWVSTHQSMRPPEEPNSEQPTRRHRKFRHEVPGGRFSGSDLDDSDSEAGDPEPAMPRRSRREQTGGVEMASAAARSSAWNHSSSPKYSSSWPLQHGSHYPQRSVPRHHQLEPEHGGYESGDESDDIFDGEFEFDETTHRRRPRRAASPVNHHHRVQQRQFQEHQIQHPQAQHPQAQHPQAQHPQAQHHRFQEHQIQHPQAQHSQSQHPEPHHQHHQALQAEPLEQELPHPTRPRRVRPPRPPVARTVVSRRSMGTIDQGHNRASTSINLCDIWRGRPEDWESPYSSDSEDGGYESDEPEMMLLEESPPRSSPQLLPPRRSMDVRFARNNDGVMLDSYPQPRRSGVWDGDGGCPRLLPEVGFETAVTEVRGGRGRAWDEGCLLPVASVRGGSGRSRRAPSRAPTERSRWTMMAPECEDRYGNEGEQDQGYYSYGFAPVVQAPSPPYLRRGGERPRFGGMALTADEECEYGGFDDRRGDRGLLSPVPSRTAAARFNFDKSWSELARVLM